MIQKHLVAVLFLTVSAMSCSPTPPAATSPTPVISPVGNSGTFVITEPAPGRSFSVHSASWSENKLVIVGEEMDFILAFVAPELKETLSLDNNAKPLPSPNYVNYPDTTAPGPTDLRYETHKIESGTFKIISVTGTGPWEIDAEVSLDGKPGHLEGTLKIRVSPPTASKP